MQNVLLVFGVNQVAGAVPFTPGGAGVQQALLVKVFAGSASTAVVAAYSVGQQIAIAAFTAIVGLGAVVFIFRFRSFKEVITAGRASREAERRPSEGRRRTTRGSERPRPRRRGCARATDARDGGAERCALLKPRARLAHERDRLGEDQRHHRADLFGLRLGVALQVDPLRPPRRSCRPPA